MNNPPDKAMKILAIDDNSDNLTALKAIAGEVLPACVVLTALGGVRGIELARAEDPDVILLDIVMPGMDGFEVCRRLKADQQTNAIPVVFVTALQTSRESRVKALEVGAEAFLVKPIDEQELVAQVRAMARLKATHRTELQEKDQLGRLVAERTAELQQELAERVAMQAVANESRRTLLSLLEDQARDQAALRKLSLAIEQSSESIVITKLDGEIEYVNDTFVQTAGYSREELIGKNPRVLNSGQTPPETYAAMWAALTQGRPWKGEFINRKKDGTEYIEFANISPLRQPDGSISHYVGVKEDTTERKRAEAERVRLEAQLRESQKMDALGTLAAGVAHDFNNALAAIIGNTELVRQDVGPGHAALVSLDEIGKASRRAKALVQQILTFGRRQTTQRMVISLEPIVQEAGQLLRSTISAEISLNVVCAPDTPSVLADATQIEQVLVNLGGNAWHALEDQKEDGLIEIRLEAEARDGLRFAVLTVRDNGSGMDEATRSRIFEPFFTTKSVDKGTGLGLAVVHTIVKTHEASIEVQSILGEGTAFAIRFAAAEAPAALGPAKNESAGDTEAGKPLTLQSQGKRVLYLDDEDSLVSLMTRLLERRGCRVSGYTDPGEALAAVRADPAQFDLVVTDYNMPAMSGLDVARTLREIRTDLPVVLISGYITEELQREAPAAGVRELVFKTDAVEDVCEVVARYTNAQSRDEGIS